MTLRQIIIQIVAIVLFVAFPTIWNLLEKFFPWWPLDPESTLNLIIWVAVIIVTWILGVLGIFKLIHRIKIYGLIVPRAPDPHFHNHVI